MSRRIQISVALVAVATIGVSLGLLAMLRIREAKEFREPHTVQTYGRTNYVVQLTEVAVGKVETGGMLIVHLRLQNPKAYEVTLNRKWFVLVDRDKDYFLPLTTGTQTELIKLPANGVLDREILSFMVPDDAFAGRVALLVGQNYMVRVKNEEPFEAHCVTESSARFGEGVGRRKGSNRSCGRKSSSTRLVRSSLRSPGRVFTSIISGVARRSCIVCSTRLR